MYDIIIMSWQNTNAILNYLIEKKPDIWLKFCKTLIGTQTYIKYACYNIYMITYSFRLKVHNINVPIYVLSWLIDFISPACNKQ